MAPPTDKGRRRQQVPTGLGQSRVPVAGGTPDEAQLRLIAAINALALAVLGRLDARVAGESALELCQRAQAFLEAPQ